MADEIHVTIPETQTTPADVQSAVTAALEEQKKKKKKKKLIILGVIAAVILLIIIGASSGGNKEGTGDGGAGVSETQKGSDGRLGDYVVHVKEAKKATNWEDKASVIVVYEFTNNSDNPQSFDIALTDHVFQNGIELESTFGDDDETSAFDIQIKPGVTMEVSQMYILRDETTPLEIEVTEWITFSDAKYTVTVEF